jgi:NAD-dependent deacetylase
MKKKILFFTGAGISEESGVSTFRGSGGLWYKYNIEDVASIEGWKKDPQKVLNFYNEIRSKLSEIEPNKAHHIIKELENDFEICVTTQNVDDLHEKAKSSNIIHLHGNLWTTRSSNDAYFTYPWKKDIEIGDIAEDGSQLRPNIVWFGEDLEAASIRKAEEFASTCDICVIVGTSMQVFPANMIPWKTKDTCIIYYIDPSDIDFKVANMRRPFFYHIQKPATSGLEEFKKELYEYFVK